MSFWKPNKTQPNVGPTQLFTFLLLLLLLLLSPTKTLCEDDPPTVYEILPKYGLPRGLLPNTVSNYTLSSSDDGSFSVSLPKPCYVDFDYLVYYDDLITGKLSYGSITDLKGIQVRKFLIWLSVEEIKVDLPPSDSIYFQVGFINKRLDVDQFNSVHSCRQDSLRFCGGHRRPNLLLPTPDNDIPMLITE